MPCGACAKARARRQAMLRARQEAAQRREAESKQAQNKQADTESTGKTE